VKYVRIWAIGTLPWLALQITLGALGVTFDGIGYVFGFAALLTVLWLGERSWQK
jgi:hypothetical protein